MVRCAAAGIPPHVFWTYTLGEITVVLEGEKLRRKNAMIDRIIACVRSIGHAFGRADALDGLVEKSVVHPIGVAEARRLRFWRRRNG